MLLEIEEQTGITPKALLDAPVLYALEKELTKAYNIMAARRTAGMASNPIQLSEIKAFIELFGHPSMPIDIFVVLIGTMDVKHLELTATGKGNGNKPTS